MEIYEFRIRNIGDKREWAKIPQLKTAVTNSPMKPGTAHKIARQLSESPICVEIRHNVRGSHQGFYTPGSVGAQIEHRNS